MAHASLRHFNLYANRLEAESVRRKRMGRHVHKLLVPCLRGVRHDYVRQEFVERSILLHLCQKEIDPLLMLPKPLPTPLVIKALHY
jgi:hypothetical protein